jgi:3-oxoacyl-[acyl-carrier protein] reductase
VRAIIATAIEHWGRLDIIVHNAALIEHSLLTECDDQAFTRQFDGGMNTGFWLIKHGYPYLKQGGGGRILFTSSVGARITAPGYGLYGAVKAGIEGLVRGAATELGADGITVNAVSPGGTKTPSLEQSLDEDVQALWSSHIPMRRLGLVEDIASAMLYLASDEASYVTGHVLTVDGGQSLPQAF